MRKGNGFSRVEMLDKRFMLKLLEMAKEDYDLDPSLRNLAEVQTLTRIVSKLK